MIQGMNGHDHTYLHSSHFGLCIILCACTAITGAFDAFTVAEDRRLGTSPLNGASAATSQLSETGPP